MWNILLKIFETLIVAVFKKFFENIKFNAKVLKYIAKITAYILTIFVCAIFTFLIMISVSSSVKSIDYNSAENEVSRKMRNTIQQCFDQQEFNSKQTTPNFMTWTRIEKNNKQYSLQFLEVLGDIEGNGIITDILRTRLNPSVYNIEHPLDERTVKLFDVLPEFTPIGFLTNDIEVIAKDNEMTIIVPKSTLNYIEENIIGVKTYAYNTDYVYFKYNPEFFTKTIIPNLGLKKNTGYQDTKLSLIWMVIAKNNSNIIYGFSWSFTDENKCNYPNGSVAKTQALTEVARYAETNVREKYFSNLI